MLNQPAKHDPKCPDCGNPFNRVKDFVRRVPFVGMVLNVYKCPSCGHLIFKSVDGKNVQPPPGENDES